MSVAEGSSAISLEAGAGFEVGAAGGCPTVEVKGAVKVAAGGGIVETVGEGVAAHP